MLRRPSVILSLAVTVVAAATLAACGSGDGAPSAGAADVSGYDSMSLTDLQAAAEKEGAVSFYTTFASDELNDLIKEFNATYPKVKVDALRLSPEDILPRIITEQRGKKYAADLVSGQSSQIGQLQQAGALSPYTPRDQAPLPDGANLPDGYTGVVYVTTTVIAYNKQVVQQQGLPEPTSYEVLTDPRWKGKFSIDPSATAWYDTLIQTMGHDKALDLIKRIGDNTPRLVESHTLAVTQVQAGEPAATATAYGYRAASLVRSGDANIGFTNTDPLSTAMNLIDPVANAPHPAAARLLEDWLLSKEGQQAIAKVTGQISLRSDVQNDPNAWDPSKWKPTFATTILPSATYNSEVSELKDALHAP